MILYKYVALDLGKTILETSQVRFTQPPCFNDPFDMPNYRLAPRIEPETQEGDLAYLDRLVMKWGLEVDWVERTGLLCLTRTPTNPLMWAHYAEGHTGMVVGFDAVVAGFTDLAGNLIPAQ